VRQPSAEPVPRSPAEVITAALQRTFAPTDSAESTAPTAPTALTAATAGFEQAGGPVRTGRERLVRLAGFAIVAAVAVVALRHQLPLLVVALVLIGYAATLTGRRLVGFVAVVAVLAAGTVALRMFVVQPFFIPSASMEPTLHGCPGCDDDHILVDKISYRLHDVHTGDIVVFDRPAGDTSPDTVLVKRVVARGGDDVQLKGGQVYVNGAAAPESHVNLRCGPAPTQPLTGTSAWQVPRHEVFVLGDNRCNSHDSRAFGPIPVSSIVGRAFVIVWPFGRIGFL
jgi:signal peptidase I